ncbi:MAG: hypothetical protein HY720_01765, partial [Planctomycetes bacterium]|nr:hypothetical protein [Planctomycetota bacterium]
PGGAGGNEGGGEGGGTPDGGEPSGPRVAPERLRELEDEFRRRGQIDPDFLARKGWTREEVDQFARALSGELSGGRDESRHPGAGDHGTHTPPFEGGVHSGSGGTGAGAVDPGHGGAQADAEKLTSEAFRKVSPEYRDEVRKYFERLAEEGGR